MSPCITSQVDMQSVFFGVQIKMWYDMARMTLSMEHIALNEMKKSEWGDVNISNFFCTILGFLISNFSRNRRLIQTCKWKKPCSPLPFYLGNSYLHTCFKFTSHPSESTVRGIISSFLVQKIVKILNLQEDFKETWLSSSEQFLRKNTPKSKVFQTCDPIHAQDQGWLIKVIKMLRCTASGW